MARFVTGNDCKTCCTVHNVSAHRCGVCAVPQLLEHHMTIMPSTMRALRARGAMVYRVTIGAYTIKRGALSTEPVCSPDHDMQQPEHWQLFTTREGAMRYAMTFDQFAPIGVPPAVITKVPARNYDVFGRLESEA